VVIAVVSAAVVLAATLGSGGPPAGGADGVRYLDPVFDAVDVTSGVVYRTATDCTGADVDLAVDIYEPAGDTATERPVYVWIHGGSFAIGSRDGALEQVVGHDYAQRGYVVVSISYRLCDDFSAGSMTDAYEDAKAAVAWVRANAATYRFDADRVAVAGASAGAITALQVGYTPSRAAGEGTPSDPSHANAVLSMAGFWLPNVVEPGEPPTFMAHGTADPVIPFSSAEGFCTGAVAAGVPCELHAYDAGHETLVVHLPDIEQRSFAWLYDVLGLDPSQESTTTTSSTSTSSTTTSATSSSTTAAAVAPTTAVAAPTTPRFTG
jgi:acetyl esterase/lipase